MWVAPSMAILTELTSEAGSRGRSTSSYADRPATTAVPLVLTLVEGVMAFSAWSAACWGVSGEACARLFGAVPLSAGNVRCVALLVLLDQVHRSLPLRTT